MKIPSGSPRNSPGAALSKGGKKFPVWQLMDGTVVVQGKDISMNKLKMGRPALAAHLRHWVYKILDKI